MLGAFESLWVVSEGSRLERVNPETGEVIAIVDAENRAPAIAYQSQALAEFDGSVWWLSKDTIYRIDPSTNGVVDSISLTAPGRAIASGPLGLFMICCAPVGQGGEPVLYEVDVAAGTLGKPIPLAATPTAVAVGNEVVWVTETGEVGFLRGINPRSGELISELGMKDPNCPIEEGGYVWCLRDSPQGEEVIGVATSTLDVGHQIALPNPLLGLSATDGVILVHSGGGLATIDAATGQVVSQPTTMVEGALPSAVAFAGGRVWLAYPEEGEVKPVSGATSNSDAEAPPDPSLSGAALAESLGLELEPSFTADCNYFVEVNDVGEGYCLEGVGTSQTERFVIGSRLKGHEPTSAEVRFFEANEAFTGLSPDDPAYESALQELDAARRALEEEQGATATPGG